MLNQIGPIWSSVDTYIEPLLKRVLLTQRVGVYTGKIELNNVRSSCGKPKGDRFELLIPYAGRKLSWQVFFDSQCPELGPDFIFDDPSFLIDPDYDTLETHIPGLVHWDPMNDDALLIVITELLMYYKKHQVNLLEIHGGQLELEYSKLIKETEICEEDVEVMLLPLGRPPMEAWFWIRMAMDFSQLPNRKNYPQGDEVMLFVVFHGPNWKRIVPQLHLSKSVRDTFGGRGALHLPPFTPESSLMNYIRRVKTLINDKISFQAMCFEKKKSFISAMLLLQRGSIIEYDAVKFSHATILLEHHDFHFLVHFKLPTEFPIEPPQITLQSVYHMTSQGELYKQVLEDVPYSPRWIPLQMVTKGLNHILEKEVANFQTNSIRSSPF